LSASGSLSNFSRAPNAATATSSALTPDVSISYNAANQTYTLSAVTTPGSTQPVTASYGPAQLDGTLGTGAYNATTAVNGVTTVSRLQVNLLPALTYSNIGEWVTGSTQADFTQNFNTIFFSYGIRTLPSDMPKTGSASYGLSIAGDSNIGGTGTLNANFGIGTVSVSLSPQYVYPNGTSNLGPITGTGTISSGTSSFASTISSNAYTGSVTGAFMARRQLRQEGASSSIRPPMEGWSQ
jgi:hypothetical protein